MRRAPLAITVGAGAGAMLWYAILARVPEGAYANDEYNLFWILMMVAAFLLGMVFQSERRWAVAGMTLAPLLAARWTAPRGDGDGLWVLVFPMLAVFGFVLLLPARVGAWFRRFVAEL